MAGKGQVFEAAPRRFPPTSLRGPQRLEGSEPRVWEDRKSRECAAIVETREVDGWKRHFACCLPVHPESKYDYCDGHDPFVMPETTGKKYVRSLRAYTRG